MTDLDRYLTEGWPLSPTSTIYMDGTAVYGVRRYGIPGATNVVLRCEHADLIREVVAARIEQAKAEALEAARGPYRCCPHCADDLIHDVEKDDHTVPCQICQNDEIRRAKAEAWEEGHAAGCAGPYAKYGECGCGPNPYRADRIEQGGQP